jgi:glycosyltransferase involved in cell wall biosynthesis
MRTLVIAGDYPWPTDTGARLRLAMTLRGLVRCGPTELCSVVSKYRTDFGEAEDTTGLARVERISFENRIPSGRPLGPTLARASMPLGMPWRDRPEVSAAVARFASGRYDLVWFYGLRPWVLAGEPALAPTVIDLIDLEDHKIRVRLSAPRPRPSGPPARARRLVADAVSSNEIRRWERLQLRAGRSAAATVVCSGIDAERASITGVPRVSVIPNGYGDPDRPVGRRSVGSPPTVLFQGLLTYPANADAARWLAGDIGRALRTRVPEARIRLVGEYPGSLADLDDPPSTTLTGRVPDVVDELADADVIVVPLRYGSGTRLKILEAFAHRIPVVSTAIGAEGLGVEDGVQLLVAESTEGLADACRRLLTEPALRQGIVAAAHAHFLEHFESGVVEEAIGRLARRTASGP